ncbi:MAG TPA: PEPxxWA-CTERM sorting domain-containing protein [Sphingomonas sp.]|uniref:PEPxxWA-CTERM sorting domain-containing protein n=1 Tax=Sphingomonas sp. TaxID=28214 RepID=UPI002CECDBC1|nr:PEPxxWA-CTERM sorting domain-containing protein [Sphingomonas sp.]HMI18248.1 PEPxxWA-CTERM sorting domain-containing protein [Sphingomonas sp.]
MRGGFLGLAAAFLLANAASAADLVHDYEFNGSSVTDSVGGINGALFGDASVSGGYLHLDGDGDYAQLDSAIFPYAPTTDFSLYFAFTGHNPQFNYTEVVSQDGGSFYVGQDPGGNVRVGDGAGSIPVAFPSGSGPHDFLLTSSASGSHLYIDGTLVWNGVGYTSSYPNPGSVTRFGRQYGPHSEFFQGDIDAIRLYDGIATYAEASGVRAAVPEPAGWAMMLGGFGLIGGLMRHARRNLRFA